MSAPIQPEIDRVRLLVPTLERWLPGFAARTSGVSDEAITELQSLAGRTFPAAYCEFLRIAGARWGTGALLYDARFDLETVREFWAALDWTLPDRYVCFGVAQRDPWFDLHLDLAHPGAELALVRFPALDEDEDEAVIDEYRSVLELSFTGMLFVRSFLDFVLPRFRHVAELASGRRSNLEAARQVLLGEGLAIEPLSTAWSCVAGSEGLGLIAHEWQGSAPLAVRLAGDDGERLRLLVQRLAGALDLELVRIG
jgi:hypothetical protein